MGAVPSKWIKWIAVVLGAAGMLTPALIELGWIPEKQALNALIFLIGFLVFDGARNELSEPEPAPELMTSTEDYFHTLGAFLPDLEHELLSVVHGHDILGEEPARFVGKLVSNLRNKKQLHVYVIVVGRIGELSDESFRRRSAHEQDPSVEGRYHYRFIDAPVSFGCQVHDQRHWTIDFPPNPADPRGAAIVFRNHPDGARLLAAFIRHQWLEKPEITMSLSEAYEKWKAIKGARANVA